MEFPAGLHVLNVRKLTAIVLNSLNFWLFVFTHPPSPRENYNYNPVLSLSSLKSLESILESTRIMYTLLMQKLSEATKLSSEIIKTATSLLFYTITTLKKYAPDEELRGLVQQQSRELVHDVHNEIVKWMQKVYGNIFGSPVGTHILSCANEELEVNISKF